MDIEINEPLVEQPYHHIKSPYDHNIYWSSSQADAVLPGPLIQNPGYHLFKEVLLIFSYFSNILGGIEAEK